MRGAAYASVVAWLSAGFLFLLQRMHVLLSTSAPGHVAHYAENEQCVITFPPSHSSHACAAGPRI